MKSWLATEPSRRTLSRLNALHSHMCPEIAITRKTHCLVFDFVWRGSWIFVRGTEDWRDINWKAFGGRKTVRNSGIIRRTSKFDRGRGMYSISGHCKCIRMSRWCVKTMRQQETYIRAIASYRTHDKIEQNECTHLSRDDPYTFNKVSHIFHYVHSMLF